MDDMMKDNEFSIPQVALYATISFLVVSLVGMLLYVTCSRRYKLNWFEKNILETANEHLELNERYILFSATTPCKMSYPFKTKASFPETVKRH